MVPDSPNPHPPQPGEGPFVRYLNWHIAAYGIAVVSVILLNYISPADRGLFIPMMLWGVGVLAHYLAARAINTDPDWVEERSENITMNSTDLSHIENIRERHDKRRLDAAKKRLSKEAKNQKAEYSCAYF